MRFFGRIEAHQGEDVDPNALLEADVGRKDALLDFERRIVDLHKGAMKLFAAVKPRCCGAIRCGQGVGAFFENRDKLLVFLDGHYQVDVVVPRNKALVSNST